MPAGTTDDDYIAALRAYYERPGTAGNVPSPDVTMEVSGRQVPLGRLMSDLWKGNLPAGEVSPALRAALDLQGCPTVDVGRRVSVQFWACPHERWRPADLVAAMRAYYKPGHEDERRHPGTLPPGRSTVNIDDRAFPIGVFARELVMGLNQQHVTPEVRDALREYGLPVREGADGKLRIDDAARERQFSDPAFQDRIQVTNPGTIITRLTGGHRFTVSKNSDDDRNLRVDISSITRTGRTVDGSGWPVRFDALDADLRAGRTRGASIPRRTLADKAEALLRASLIDTLLRQVTANPPAGAAISEVLHRRRAETGLSLAQAVTGYQEAKETVRREPVQRAGRAQAAAMGSASASNPVQAPAATGRASSSGRSSGRSGTRQPSQPASPPNR
ncbi:hypothetical protein [Phytohabitans suffuscus]|uniref:Uncharacterized protein n=1 Tax=Phytohabitans suffuscus TaxID=624315 RepID=A0A6F8YTS7_9ACTN|nr:hypothetical protein [Phytohabitans suffuscus]BCB89522.1 hypothetical protein Psuf_068350 [Phytohabitans suffuscus]